MCTEMSLHPDEFDHFQVGVNSDITFCLKELRVMGLFSDSPSPCLMRILCVCVCVCDWLTGVHFTSIGHISDPVVWVLKCPKASVPCIVFMWTFPSLVWLILLAKILWPKWRMWNYYTGEVIEVMSSRNYGCAAFSSSRNVFAFKGWSQTWTVYIVSNGKNSWEWKYNVISRVACSLDCFGVKQKELGWPFGNLDKRSLC